MLVVGQRGEFDQGGFQSMVYSNKVWLACIWFPITFRGQLQYQGEDLQILFEGLVSPDLFEQLLQWRHQEENPIHHIAMSNRRWNNRTRRWPTIVLRILPIKGSKFEK